MGKVSVEGGGSFYKVPWRGTHAQNPHEDLGSDGISTRIESGLGTMEVEDDTDGRAWSVSERRGGVGLSAKEGRWGMLPRGAPLGWRDMGRGPTSSVGLCPGREMGLAQVGPTLQGRMGFLG